MAESGPAWSPCTRGWTLLCAAAVAAAAVATFCQQLPSSTSAFLKAASVTSSRITVPGLLPSGRVIIDGLAAPQTQPPPSPTPGTRPARPPPAAGPLRPLLPCVLGVALAGVLGAWLRVQRRHSTSVLQPLLMAAVAASAPASVADAYELWAKQGHTILDIRSDMEKAEGRLRGPNKGAFEAPMFRARSMYDSALGRKVVFVERNEEWLEDLKAVFARDAPIIVMCSDGNQRTKQAVELLRANGFTAVSALPGGYNAWDQVFDKQLRPRPAAQQKARAWQADPVDWGRWAPAGTSPASTSTASAAPTPPRLAPAVAPRPAPATSSGAAVPQTQTQKDPAPAADTQASEAAEGADPTMGYIFGLAVAATLTVGAVTYSQSPAAPASVELEKVVQSLLAVPQKAFDISVQRPGLERVKEVKGVVEGAAKTLEEQRQAVGAVVEKVQSAAEAIGANAALVAKKDAGPTAQQVKAAAEAASKAAEAVQSQAAAVNQASQKAAAMVERVGGVLDRTAQAIATDPNLSKDEKAMTELGNTLTQVVATVESEVAAVTAASEEVAKLAKSAVDTIEQNAVVVVEASAGTSAAARVEKALDTATAAVSEAADEVAETLAKAAEVPLTKAQAEEAVAAVRDALAEAVEAIDARVDAVRAAARDAVEVAQSAADDFAATAKRATADLPKNDQGKGVAEKLRAATNAVANAADTVDSKASTLSEVASEAVKAINRAGDALEDKAALIGEVGNDKEALASLGKTLKEVQKELDTRVQGVNRAAEDTAKASQDVAAAIRKSAEITGKIPKAADMDKDIQTVVKSVDIASKAIQDEAQAVSETGQRASKLVEAAGEALGYTAILETPGEVPPEKVEKTMESLRTSLTTMVDALKPIEVSLEAPQPNAVKAALPVALAGSLAVAVARLVSFDKWELDAKVAREMLQSAGAVLVDIRSPESIKQVPKLTPGRVVLASVPRLPPAVRQRTQDADKVEQEQFAPVVAQMAGMPGKQVVVLATTGSQGQQFASFLRANGVQEAYYVAGGFGAWRRDTENVRDFFDGYGS